MASVFNEYAMKSQFQTSIYHQVLGVYGKKKLNITNPIFLQIL